MNLQHKTDNDVLKPKIRKKVIVIIVVAVLFVASLIVVFLYKSKLSNTEYVSLCSEVNGVSAKDINKLLLKNDAEKIRPLQEVIVNNKKYDNDADCQYIALGYSTSVSDPAEAQNRLDIIKKINKDYSPMPLFGYRSLSLSAYETNIKFLTESAKASGDSVIPESASERVQQ